MLGTIYKKDEDWIVFTNCVDTQLRNLPLHPDDIKKIKELSLIFDNIDGRILSNPEVNYEIVRWCDYHSCDQKEGSCTLDCGYTAKLYAKIIYDKIG